MLISRRFVFVLGLAIGGLWAQPAFVPVSLEELCGMSDVIVDATVDRLEPTRLNSARKLETPVAIAVTAVLKGPAGLKTLELVEPGGKIGARNEVYYGQLIPKQGERYVLFLKLEDGGRYSALGGLHGHYRVVDGRIVAHPAMPRILKTGFDKAPVEKLLGEVRAQLGK